MRCSICLLILARAVPARVHTYYVKTFSEENNKISSDVDADNSSKSYDSTDLYPSLKPKKRKTKGDFHCGGCECE
jgi:hypothetical protein